MSHIHSVKPHHLSPSVGPVWRQSGTPHPCQIQHWWYLLLPGYELYLVQVQDISYLVPFPTSRGPALHAASTPELLERTGGMYLECPNPATSETTYSRVLDQPEQVPWVLYPGNGEGRWERGEGGPC